MNPVLLTANSTGVEFTATVVIAGIGIVFGVLVLLIAIFYAFGAIVSKSENAAKKRAMKKLDEKLKSDNASAPAPVSAVPSDKKSVKSPPAAPAQPIVQQGVSDEVVAAISAAITMFEGDSPVRICSISRKKTASNRNAWSYAALTENTRPF